MRLAAILFALALTAATTAPTAPTELAQRYVAATGGVYALFQEQSYAAASTIPNQGAAQNWQQALASAAAEHRADLDALDASYAELVAKSVGADELAVAVHFYEGPAGRAIISDKAAYYGVPYSRGHSVLALPAADGSALSIYDETAEGAAMNAKMPAVLAQLQILAAPVQKAIVTRAKAIYCHASSKCLNAEGNYDQVAGPIIRGGQ